MCVHFKYRYEYTYIHACVCVWFGQYIFSCKAN